MRKNKIKSRRRPVQDKERNLWLNRNITIGRKVKKVMCYKDWYKNGIILIHDLVKEDGNMKTLAELEAEFNIQVRPMDYNSLISAIPTNWKKALKQMRIPAQAVSSQEQPYIKCSGRLLALGIITNRYVCWKLIRRK